MEPNSPDADAVQTRKENRSLLVGLTSAHAIFHFMHQSFSVMIPAIKDTLALNPVQIGAIVTAKELAAGFASLPGGIVSDYLRRHRAVIMAACMALFGLGWLFIGVSPLYPILIAGMMVQSIAASVWHLPSMAEISSHFVKRRGAALAVHGAGGSLGDIFGPVITGVLLGVFTWQGLISVYAFVPLVMSAWVLWSFKGVVVKPRDEKSAPGGRDELKQQIRATRALLRQGTIWKVNLVAGFRSMCYNVYITFLPLYMKEDLEMSATAIGFHFGLLWTIGIVASPIMGHLSDRWGRKPVLVPALLCSAILTLLIALFGKGVLFTGLLAVLGLFLRSDYSILSATLLDITGQHVATTVLGILSFSRFIIGAASPLIAGALYASFGMRATLFFIAALFAASAAIFAGTRLHRPSFESTTG